MQLNGKNLDSVVITPKESGRLVTADDTHEVIAIISDDNVVEKDGYEVKLIPAETTTSADFDIKKEIQKQLQLLLDSEDYKIRDLAEYRLKHLLKVYSSGIFTPTDDEFGGWKYTGPVVGSKPFKDDTSQNLQDT